MPADYADVRRVMSCCFESYVRVETASCVVQVDGSVGELHRLPSSFTGRVVL